VTSRSARPAASSRCASTRLAKQICTHCPLQAGRLGSALSSTGTLGDIGSGIWDGTTPKQRAQIRPRHRAAA
jgi:Transcription factor WhiB